MRSSRGKAPLRMTSVVSDEILTRESTAQDDGFFKHCYIFRIGYKEIKAKGIRRRKKRF
jgi:hypothetical protein